MRKTLYEFSKLIFDKVVEISYEDIEFHVTNKIEYAKIEYKKISKSLYQVHYPSVKNIF